MTAPTLTGDLRKAAHHLIWVWYQYGGGYESESGTICLPHRNMQAGEGACDLLTDLGLGQDQGWQFELNDAGRKLFDVDDIDADGAPQQERKTPKAYPSERGD